MSAPLGAAPGQAIPGLFVPGLPGPFPVVPPPPAPPATGGRIDGARGIVYVAVAAGAEASPAAFVEEWTISIAQTWIDVTGIGAEAKEYVTGIPEVSGSFSGWYDDATSQVYIAAGDGVPRKFYLYPAAANAGQFFSGTILPDFAVKGGVQDAVAVACTWQAASFIDLTDILVTTYLQDEAFNDILDQAYGVMS